MTDPWSTGIALRADRRDAAGGDHTLVVPRLRTGLVVDAGGLGAPAVAAIVIGVITAVGGGVARDLLAGDVPVILYSEI